MLSRVADNLYWMSRYMERAQHTARLLDAALGFMLDQSPQLIERRWKRTLRSLHVREPRAPHPDEVFDGANIDAYALAHRLAFDANNDVSIFSCVRAARENARQVREEISGEMWECLNRLYLRVREARPALESGSATADTSGLSQSMGSMTQTISTQGMIQSMGSRNQAFWRQPHEFFSSVQRSAFEFEGATDATMRHGQGWLFIQVGRGLEQAAKTASLLNAYFSETPPEADGVVRDEGNLKWTALLKSCAAFEPYCRTHSPRLSPEKIGQFLLLDAEFPRSVHASIVRVESALREISDITGKDTTAPNFTSSVNQNLPRRAGRLRAELDYASLEEVMEAGLPPFLNSIQEECVRIHYAIYHSYIGYMAE
jgi:uncharacterized alpha-E superfamily protein